MRKVFLEDLPRTYKGIDWGKVVDNKIKINFIYDDIKGHFIINSIKGTNANIEYSGEQHNINTRSIKSCGLAKILGLVNDNTIFNIGEIKELSNTSVEIVDKFKGSSNRQIYKVKCLKCGKEWNISYKNIINKTKCNGCSLTNFKISNDSTYWIGITQKGEEFWFDGDDKTVEYIKSCTWRKTTYDYFQNGNGEKLHRVVMGVEDPDIFVNHLGGNRWDNRKEKLAISNCSDNSREKKTNGRSGIVGLLKRKNRWVGNIKVNEISIYSKYNTKEEALIDLLIMQRHYGFRHNQNLYYMLNNISFSRINKVISNCERQLNKKRDDKICSTNKFEISEDMNFYWVYDKDENKHINRFKINIDKKELIEKGIWHIAVDKQNNKPYVHGTIIVNNIRKTVKLHRYLMDVLDIKYKQWFIDHLNGDGLDNRIENLVITDAQGNGLNKPVKGYSFRFGKFRVMLTLFGERFSKTVETEEEAIELVKQKRKEAMNKRLEFKTREELDKYLEQLHIKNAS